MKNSFYLAYKDATSYFQSWIGVVISGFFLLLSGIFFTLLIFTYAKLSLDASQNAYEGVQGLGLTRFVFSSFFINLSVLLMFLVPLLTMRSFAEERRHETLELLFTYPLSDFEIVWGKFLGLISFFGFLVSPTLLYLFVILALGSQFDPGPILMGYFGFALLAMAYFSLGLFISSISESPIVSAALTFACLVVFWILEWVVLVSDGALARFLAALSPLGHYQEFTLGVFDLSHFVYFIFFTLYFLFLTLRSIEVRNWKG